MDKTKVTFTDGISVEDFCALRESAGFKRLTTAQAQRIITHTTYIAAAQYEGRCIGVARLLFDYGVDAYITDLIVNEAYRKNGIGRALIENLMFYIRENSCGVKVDVSLFVIQGKEPFYEKFGFSQLPNEHYGHGMHLDFDCN